MLTHRDLISNIFHSFTLSPQGGYFLENVQLPLFFHYLSIALSNEIIVIRSNVGN